MTVIIIVNSNSDSDKTRLKETDYIDTVGSCEFSKGLSISLLEN